MNVNQLNTWARIIDALARYGALIRSREGTPISESTKTQLTVNRLGDGLAQTEAIR